MNDDDARKLVMDRVRRALGRGRDPREAPTPPAIDEPTTRLVHSDIGLPALFAKVARENQMGVDLVSPENLDERIVDFLRQHSCRRVAAADEGLVAKLRVLERLRGLGFDARAWTELAPDELYEFDCGLTGVWAAVAETGSLVVRGSEAHGRSLSLVAPVHVAIVEAKQFLPDLVDLFEKLAAEPHPGNTVIITGPSKTADIEMTLVTGVHGPGVVQVFVLA